MARGRQVFPVVTMDSGSGAEVEWCGTSSNGHLQTSLRSLVESGPLCWDGWRLTPCRCGFGKEGRCRLGRLYAPQEFGVRLTYKSSRECGALWKFETL